MAPPPGVDRPALALSASRALGPPALDDGISVLNDDEGDDDDDALNADRGGTVDGS